MKHFKGGNETNVKYLFTFYQLGVKKTIIFSQTIEEAAEEGESEVFDEVNISHDFFFVF